LNEATYNGAFGDVGHGDNNGCGPDDSYPDTRGVAPEGVVVAMKYEDELMANACELRYEYGQEGRVKVSNTKPPYLYNEWRSIECTDGSVLLVIDFDCYPEFSAQFKKRIIEICSAMSVKPALKFSGLKGIHAIFRIKNFNRNYYSLEAWVVDQMKGIGDVHIRPRGSGSVPGINVDLAMYTQRRMLRGFGPRFSPTGDIIGQSVPMYYDHVEQWAIPEIIVPDVYPPRDTPKPASNGKKVLDKLAPVAMDEVYKCLTPGLRCLLHAWHPSHAEKVRLVIYLRGRLGLEPEEITNWLFTYAKWKDLTSVETTHYHVSSVCRGCDSGKYIFQEGEDD
jgi:hypothetical protein